MNFYCTKSTAYTNSTENILSMYIIRRVHHNRPSLQIDFRLTDAQMMIFSKINILKSRTEFWLLANDRSGLDLKNHKFDSHFSKEHSNSLTEIMCVCLPEVATK